MNSNVEVAFPQPSKIDTWNRESDSYRASSSPEGRSKTGRDAVALFPSGRFFDFPVRVRIRVAGDVCAEKTFTLLTGADLDATTEHLRTEVGSVVWALIENASCCDTATPLPEIIFFGDVVVDFRKMDLRQGGKRIEATALEFEILHYFLLHPEVAISRDELLNHVWGCHSFPTTRTVDNRILQLRKKLENDPARPVHFLTVHGVGYKFVP